MSILNDQAVNHTTLPRFIFVETNYTSAAGIALVRKLGFSPILFTHIREFYPDYYSQSQLDQFDEVYDVDTHNVHAMYAIVRALKMKVKGILACFDNNTLAAAYIAKKLSLPHPAIKGIKRALSKIAIRKILDDKNFIQPKFAVADYNDIPTEPLLAYPFVIKPDNDAGSRGAFICRTPQDYVTARQKLHLIQHTETGSKRSKIIFEEFIPGDLYAAQVLWHEGQWHIPGVIQVLVNPDTSLAVNGIIYPTQLSEKEITIIKEHILRWVNCVGLQGGGLDIEFKLLNGQPVLIEINPRLGGARVNKIFELAMGMSMIEELVYWACGISEPKQPTNLLSDKFYINAYYFAEGKVTDVNIDQINRENLIAIEYKKPPFTIEDDAHSVQHIVGHLIASGDDYLAALKNAKQIIEKIEITTCEP